ncbi:MAG: DUF2851 family protein [Verrucomicrobia bacterium]|nr:DUF2851 family protein [Verrucomicrobiota bacterium]
MKPEIIAEIEGEYGPLTISERLVQKIWARGEFRRTDLKTLEGSSLEIVDLGKWNLLAGPDFKDVSILVDGQKISGDAELHFFESDWEAHGHETDPAFRNVVLHILVFPPKARRRLVQCSVDNSLLFLELLPQGLESYAEEEALGALTVGSEPALSETLLTMPLSDRLSLLVDSAHKRWRGKVVYARKRIEALGWEEACHQTALEILGYRYNRAVMLFVAGDYSLNALRSGNYKAADLYEAGQRRWRVSGTRPANHPRQRLEQYLDWVGQRPLWPDEMEGFLHKLPRVENDQVLEVRRKDLELNSVRSALSKTVLADTVGGTRIENLVSDGFLPLLAAQSDRTLFSVWFHWFPGDVPAVMKQVSKEVTAGASRPIPICNGGLQGILQQLLDLTAPTREK